MNLSIKNLTRSFGEKLLFRDLSLSFDTVGIYAFCAESGAGKTTLLRIIAGLDRDFCGEVLGGGFENCSVCFQENRLFPALSAFDNVFKVSFSEQNEENRRKTNALLGRLMFSENDMKLYPDELSGGMRQRVAFARAVLKKSPILILDEATKELDAALVDTVLDIIKEEASTRLVLIVTHKPEELVRLGAKIINI